MLLLLLLYRVSELESFELEAGSFLIVVSCFVYDSLLHLYFDISEAERATTCEEGSKRHGDDVLGDPSMSLRTFKSPRVDEVNRHCEVLVEFSEKCEIESKL